MRNIRIPAATVATATTLALVLTACSGSGGDTPEPEEGGAVTIDAEHSVGAMEDFEVGTTFQATEPVELSLMYRDHPNYPVKEDWSIFQNLEANQNVTFARTDVPLADWDNKKSLLIGAGDANDIIPVTYPGQEVQFVAGGSILAVSDYVEYMPNFADKVERWGLQDQLDSHRQADGKYYILPGLREIPDVQYSVVVNDDLFTAAGITEEPETWDELAEQLATVKEENGLTYAMTDRWTDTTPLGAMLQYIAPNYGTEGGWGYSNTWFDEDSGEFQLTGTTDGYKEMVTYAAGLVSDGVLDPEITQNDDQAIQKFVNGDVAAISGNTQEITNYRNKLSEAGSDATLRMVVLPDGPFGGYVSPSQLSSGLMISSDAADKPYFKALLQFVDWLYYSDEGIEFAQWGVVGETYAKDGDTRVLNADVGWNALNPGAPKMLNADFGYFNGVFLLANGSTTDLLQSVMDEETRAWTDAVLARKDTLPVKPAANLDELELEQASLLDTQIKDAVHAATAGFVTGQRSLDEWDAYVAEIDGLGGTQLIDTFNTALERSQG